MDANLGLNTRDLSAFIRVHRRRVIVVPHPAKMRNHRIGGAATHSPALALVLALLFALCAGAADVPRRIVSLSPNLTEILYGIGAFPQVAGVTDYCSYPPEVVKIPSVGGWANPSLEKLLALRPDLVILDDAQAPLFEQNFHDLGLRTLVARDHNIEQVYGAMATLGAATGHAEAARKLAAATREGLAQIARKTAALSHPSVVLIVDRTPGTLRDLYAVTEGGYLAELVAIAGGRITGPPARSGYGKMSKEDLLAINPDVILDFTHAATGSLAAAPLDAWQELPELRAVRARRVYGVNEDYVPHPSQRMVQTAGLFARLLHRVAGEMK
jgi:iron complex transport system substrate-binding protein